MLHHILVCYFTLCYSAQNFASIMLPIPRRSLLCNNVISILEMNGWRLKQEAHTSNNWQHLNSIPVRVQRSHSTTIVSSHQLYDLGHSFSNTDVLSRIKHCCGDCPVHHWVLSSTPVLYPRDESGGKFRLTGLELQLSHNPAVIGGVSSRKQIKYAQGNAGLLVKAHTG